MPKKKNKITVLPKPEEGLLEIKKLVNIIATQIALDRIEKLKWTEKQKAIWVLCDGSLTRKQLAQKSGVHLNTVEPFIGEAMTYGLLEEEKAKGGHPKRVIDYAPSEWKSYIKKKEVVNKSGKAETPKSDEEKASSNDEQ